MNNNVSELVANLYSHSIYNRKETLGQIADNLVSPYLQQQRDERNSLTSPVQPHSYIDQWKNERKDILKFLPAVTVETFPKSGNEGLYGWVFKNKDGKIHLRQDLVDYQDTQKWRTFIHEATHRAGEYETRESTEEKLGAMFQVEKKYDFLPPEYLD